MKKKYCLIIVFLLTVIMLNACSDGSKRSTTLASRQAFKGIVIADEPQAAVIGRDILSKGGSAGDAMVAMGMAMTVTLPSRVGLDGSGFCQVYNPKQKNVQTLDFITNNLKGETVLPAMPRAMFALYAQTDNLRWQELVFPAENLAKFDMKISRAFANDLESLYSKEKTTNNLDVLRLINHFSNTNKQPLTEGASFTQFDLAAVLSSLRTSGIGDFYSGHLAKRYLEKVFDFYKDITPESLSLYSPRWLASEKVKFGNEQIYFPSSKLGSSFGSNLWNNLTNGKKDDVQKAAKELNQKPLANNIYSTSAVAVDDNGMAVACVFSMGELFGDKRRLLGLGIIKSSSALNLLNDETSKAMASSLIIINENVNEFRFAGSATGEGALTDLIKLTSRATSLPRKDLSEVLASQIANQDNNSSVNAIYCNEGLPPFPDSCDAVNDPRRSGYLRFSGVPTEGHRPQRRR